MLAARIDRFGPPEVLRIATVPDPEPQADQVLIRVAIASITFVETQLRAGRPPHEAMRPQLPVVLGNGVGGTIAAVGDHVDPAWTGRRVVAGLTGRGGYAQRAVTNVERLVAVPDTVELADATAVLADGRTALLLVERLAAALGGLAGRTVLVTAAAGGVGGLLVQLLRSAGARVVGAAGGVRKTEHVRSLGADRAVDHRALDWAGATTRDLGAVDAVLDAVGGEVAASAHSAVRDGGIVLAYGMAGGPTPPLPERLRGVDAGAPSAAQSVALSRRAVALVAAGQLAVTVGARLPLEQAAAAHAGIEARTVVGKTLLIVS